MSYATSVNPQSPTRTITAKPLRRGFHYAGGYEVIAIPAFICIFVKSRQNYPWPESYEVSICILTSILVRQAEQFSEQSIKIGSNSRSLGITHAAAL
jgi:hypothetical protein